MAAADNEGKRAAAEKVFAAAYCDSLNEATYQNAGACYTILRPKVTGESARKAGYRFLKRPGVQVEIARLTAVARAVAGVSAPDRIAGAFTQADTLFAKALELNDAKFADVAVKYYALGMKASGLLVNRTEDMTPPERKLPAAISLDQIIEAAQRMKRLNEPNPMPLGITAPTVDVEYEIVKDTEGGAEDGAGVDGG